MPGMPAACWVVKYIINCTYHVPNQNCLLTGSWEEEEEETEKDLIGGTYSPCSYPGGTTVSGCFSLQILLCCFPRMKKVTQVALGISKADLPMRRNFEAKLTY